MNANRRERLQHPLDDVPSIKLKLGFVIAAAVAVTVFVFWVGIKLGVWPSVSGIIAAAVAMTMVWFLSRGMTSPLREMAAAASEMARGNYDRRVSTSSRDEVGELAKALNQLNVNLQAVVADVRHEVEGVQVASQEIASGNHDLSSRTEAQASNLEETAASMDQMNSTVAQSAGTAGEAARLGLAEGAVMTFGPGIVVPAAAH